MYQQTDPTQGQTGAQHGSQITGQGEQSMGTEPQQFGQSGGQQMGGIGQQGATEQMGQGSASQPTAHGAPGQQMGLSLQDVESPEQRAAVDDISWAIQVCGWCAGQCIEAADPNMVACIRHCEDVTELGETALALVPRNSPSLQPVLQAFQQAAQACARECGQHQHAHCQECAQVLPQVAQSVQQFLETTRHQ